jgi:exonuclease V gamma subunit
MSVNFTNIFDFKTFQNLPKFAFLFWKKGTTAIRWTPVRRNPVCQTPLHQTYNKGDTSSNDISSNFYNIEPQFVKPQFVKLKLRRSITLSNFKNFEFSPISHFLAAPANWNFARWQTKKLQKKIFLVQ